MRLSELIENLEELAELLEEEEIDDPEVAIATQPSWPLRSSLHGVKVDIKGGVLFLVAGQAADYARKDLWNEGEWQLDVEEEEE